MIPMLNPVDREYEDLSLHVELCASRYNQLIERLNNVDQRLLQMDQMLIDIKQTIVNTSTQTSDRYLKWAGFIILTLVTTTGALLSHLLFR